MRAGGGRGVDPDSLGGWTLGGRGQQSCSWNAAPHPGLSGPGRRVDSVPARTLKPGWTLSAPRATCLP